MRIIFGLLIWDGFSILRPILDLSKIWFRNNTISINILEWVFYVQPKGAVEFIGRTHRKIILNTTNIYLIWNWYINLVITHNWIGSLRRGTFWFLDIVWSNCWGKDRVLFTVQVFDYRKIYRTDYWTFVNTVEEEVLSHLAYYFVAFHLKINYSRPRGAGNTVLHHVIWSAICTNKWLPAKTIISTFKICDK